MCLYMTCVCWWCLAGCKVSWGGARSKGRGVGTGAAAQPIDDTKTALLPRQALDVTWNTICFARRTQQKWQITFYSSNTHAQECENAFSRFHFLVFGERKLRAWNRIRDVALCTLRSEHLWCWSFVKISLCAFERLGTKTRFINCWQPMYSNCR